MKSSTFPTKTRNCRLDTQPGPLDYDDDDDGQGDDDDDDDGQGGGGSEGAIWPIQEPMPRPWPPLIQAEEQHKGKEAEWDVEAI